MTGTIDEEMESAADRADVDRLVMRQRNPFLALAMVGALLGAGASPGPSVVETPRCTMAESSEKIAAAEEKRRRRAFKRSNRGKPK